MKTVKVNEIGASIIFAKSAYGPNAVTEGRNNAKASGLNSHAEGMNDSAVIIVKNYNHENPDC